MRLEHPNVRYKDSYLAAQREFQAEGINMEFDLDKIEADFEDFVETRLLRMYGKRLPNIPGAVPCTHFWLIDGDEFVGELRLRHYLSPELVDFAGHIGYEVRPSARGKGFAKAALSKALLECKKMFITKALLTVDKENAASKKVIESNGGEYWDEVSNPVNGKPHLRYWIKVDGFKG